MFGIGAGEFVVILIVALIVFGPSKLPEVGRAIGKGLRELRKAQAALSQTLNEVDVTEKKSSTVAEKSVTETSVEKISPVEKTATVAEKSVAETSVEKISPVEKSSTVAEKSVADTSAEKISPPTVTVDDVIKFAKESPLVKENHHEKISDGNPFDVADNAARTSSAGARSSSNGVDKQP